MSAPTWTRESIIDSIRRFAAIYGRPPKSAEWKGKVSGEGWPSAAAVARHGGWATMIEAAGFPRPVYNAPRNPEKRAERGVQPDDRPFPINGVEAARFGAIVTLENDEGQRLVLHRTGTVGTVIAATLATALSLDPTFKVVCVSTPTYVYRDLQGHRLGQSIAWPSLPEIRMVPKGMMHASVRLADV